MWTLTDHCRCLCVPAVISWVLLTPCAAAQTPTISSSQSSETADVHGSPALLAEKLVRQRELEAWLREATADSARLNSPAAEALSQLLAAPTDCLSIDPETGAIHGVRRRAVQFLRDASVELQREWQRLTGAMAESRLTAALQSSRREDFQKVSQEFPLTESGLRAAVIHLTQEYFRGRNHLVRTGLAELEHTYSGTVLDAEFRDLTGPLRQLLGGSLPDSGTSPPSDRNTAMQLSVPSRQQQHRSAPPWPVPVWEFREWTDSYPGAPQPEAARILNALIPGALPGTPGFSNWKPVLWHDQVVMRTPFRLCGLEPKSGTVLWSITTDTFQPDMPQTSEQHARGEPENLLEQRAWEVARPDPKFGSAWGLMSQDSDYLYFVDGFEFFSAITPRTIERRKSGTSLVALRRTPAGRPAVAWTVGTRRFDYEIHSGGSIPSLNEQDDSEHPADGLPPMHSSGTEPAKLKTLEGHLFTSPPAGDGDRVFVISLHADQFFLNALERTTGRVLWQQPLAYSEGRQEPEYEAWALQDRTSVCFVSGDLVVCALSDGLLVAVRTIDGSMLWATAIREDRPLRLNGFPSYYPSDAKSSAICLPVESQGVIVTADEHSDHIYAVSSSSGEILWKASRRAFGPGDVGGSPDEYVAGISNDHVVLIGERHCRSLDLKTGVQNWTVPLGKTTGRADCGRDFCLIPVSGGQVMAVRVADGTEIPHFDSLHAPDLPDLAGSVTQLNGLVCLTTPVSMVVCPSVSEIIARSQQTTEPATLIQRCLAMLMQGETSEVRELLKDTIELGRAENRSSPELESFLADLVLQHRGRQTDSYHRSPPYANATEFRPQAAVGADEDLRLLANLTLSPEQRFRAAVLTLAGGGQHSSSATDLQQQQKSQLWNRAIQISESWSVRPDLLLGKSSLDSAAFEHPDRVSHRRLRQLASQSILFPELLPTEDSQLRLFQELLSRDLPGFAECVLAASNPAGYADQLQQLHVRDHVPGNAVVLPPPNASPVLNDTTRLKGLTSEFSGSLTAEIEYHLRLPELETETAEKGLRLHSLPSWNGLRYFLLDGTPGEDGQAFPDLVSIDPEDGAQRDRLQLPFPFSYAFQDFRPLLDSHRSPGLMPVAGADAIVMISCPSPGRARILWTREFQTKDAQQAGVEYGSLGASHFVWHAGEELRCSHPLTGEDLWTRKLRLSPTDSAPERLRRMFGDDQVTVVLGADYSSYDRFRTRDGQWLGSGRLKIDRLDDAVSVGRCLLYADAESRLHLFDGLSEEDRLATEPPIVLSPVSVRRSHRVLTEGRIVVVVPHVDGAEIVLIDTLQNRIGFRRTVPIETGSVFGMTAFERHGALFVGVEDLKRFADTTVELFDRWGETRLGDGALVCLHPEDGAVRWSTRIASSIVPAIHGDPTDLLVLWSRSRQRSLELQRLDGSDGLLVRILSERDGTLVHEDTFFSTGQPSRCVHHGASRSLEFTTRDSLITLRPQPDPDRHPD